MPGIIMPHQHNKNLNRLLDTIPVCEELEIVANVFKEVSESSRIRIFWVLCHCEECVTNLSAMMEMTAPAVSHHLSRLKASGLITFRRKGKEVYYRAAGTHIADTLHHMIESMVEITCPEGEPSGGEDENQ